MRFIIFTISILLAKICISICLFELKFTLLFKKFKKNSKVLTKPFLSMGQAL